MSGDLNISTLLPSLQLSSSAQNRRNFWPLSSFVFRMFGRLSEKDMFKSIDKGAPGNSCHVRCPWTPIPVFGMSPILDSGGLICAQQVVVELDPRSPFYSKIAS